MRKVRSKSAQECDVMIPAEKNLSFVSIVSKHRTYLAMRPLANSQKGILWDLVPPIVIINISEQKHCAANRTPAKHVSVIRMLRIGN